MLAFRRQLTFKDTRKRPKTQPPPPPPTPTIHYRLQSAAKNEKNLQEARSDKNQDNKNSNTSQIGKVVIHTEFGKKILKQECLSVTCVVISLQLLRKLCINTTSKHMQTLIFNVSIVKKFVVVEITCGDMKKVMHL